MAIPTGVRQAAMRAQMALKMLEDVHDEFNLPRTYSSIFNHTDDLVRNLASGTDVMDAQELPSLEGADRLERDLQHLVSKGGLSKEKRSLAERRISQVQAARRALKALEAALDAEYE